MNNSNGGRVRRTLRLTCLFFLPLGCLPQGKISASNPSSEVGSNPDQASIVSTCSSPIRPVDVSSPTTVVGTGAGASCTEQALDEAIRIGGIITFNCGGNATIQLTSEKELRTDVDTTIDGLGQITLDGNGSTRLFHFEGPDFRRTGTTVSFQNIALINGAATGTPIPEYPNEPPQCSRGFQADGAGAAIWIRDGVLHVYNTLFQDNHAAPLGPDVAGGAIYGLGAREVVVVRSRFVNNSASNGGAIGALNTDVTVINSTFTQSAALGHDANNWDPDCPDEESGSGGNGGAIYVDGGFDLTDVFCGNTFSGSRGGENALGGAIFRAADDGTQVTTIDQCTFDGNYSPLGGALYFHNTNLQISKSTFANNTAVIGGSLQADGTLLTVENSTFFNSQTSGPWGAIALFDGRGDLRNCTFVGNRADFSPIVPDFADVTIENSIFLGNVAIGGNTDCDYTSAGSGNVQWPDPGRNDPNSLSGCVLGVSIGDPQAGDLGNHGGPTRTFLPAPSGGAAGRGTSCPEVDQRNLPRSNRNACTAGSVEVQ